MQGLALHPAGRMWSVEHGPDVDDEVNRLRRGGNYGWDPASREAGDPVYVEARPMTDFTLPGPQVGAAWSSGPTGAASGATWLEGARWGEWEGALAVAELQGETLVLVRFTPNGALIDTTDVLTGSYGRLRTAQLGPGNALYLTTSNGVDDQVLRVVPETS